jgi:hypothetical protein
MKHFLSVAVAAALLAACESAPVWKKADASEAMMKDDAYGCHAKVRVSPSTHPKPPPSVYGAATVLDADDARLRYEQEEFRRCMEEKGYSAKR